MPDLGGATSWLNSAPLSRESLRSRVVLVHFWTYTCINWLRTLPYIRAWSNTYKDRGLVVLGIPLPAIKTLERQNVFHYRRDQVPEMLLLAIEEYSEKRVREAFDRAWRTGG